MTEPRSGVHVTASGRLRLRAPTADNLDVVFRIHADPATNVHNPAGPDRDRRVSSMRLDAWLEHWDRHGFGYWVVERSAVGPDGQRSVVGFTGVRHEQWLGQPVLNLYYRLAPEHWGHGYATELARYAVSWARESMPDRPVMARTTKANIASQRTAAAAGLSRRPDLERDVDGIPTVIFVSHWSEPTPVTPMDP